MEIPAEHQRIARFIHCSKLLLCCAWAVACILLYWYAPSYQAEQLYDCRWHPSSLLISAGLGALLLRSPSTLVFSGAFIATQYAVVYSFLALVIYCIDSVLILTSPLTDMNYAPYLKLTTVMVLVNLFGLVLSIFHLHRLFLIGWSMDSPKMFSKKRLLKILAVIHAVLAVFTMYVVEELTPYKTWYIRVYVVHEFSSSLLSLSLAVLQFLVVSNCNPLLLRMLLFANGCQFLQEVNISLTSYYTTMYISKVSQLLEGDVFFRQVIVALNIIAHFLRIGTCAAAVRMIVPEVFGEQLELRVRRTVDSERLTAADDLAAMEKKEHRQLVGLAIGTFLVATGHVALNTAYALVDAVYESLNTATGLSFLFSLLSLAALMLYIRRRYRFALVCGAFFALNMFTTSLLLLSSFVQEAAFGYSPSGTARRPTLYLSDLVLSTLTFLVAAYVLRFAMRTLIETTTLQTQPARVTKAVKWLTRIGLLGLFSVAIEFLLLLELRSDSKGELSISSSIYDWLIMFVQSGFLYWSCRHERYQSVLLLVSVAVTSFDLIAQQTDLVQMFTVLLFHHDRAAAKLKDDVSHFPISHFVVFMVMTQSVSSL
ncbi:hypothetical protein AAVH_19896 [Aphelenchoides avenae]|nr:hypothetical protein AAVH_19896 [Aphelenchus avenae]